MAKVVRFVICCCVLEASTANSGDITDLSGCSTLVCMQMTLFSTSSGLHGYPGIFIRGCQGVDGGIQAQLTIDSSNIFFSFQLFYSDGEGPTFSRGGGDPIATSYGSSIEP